jgi:hypothetical protein
VTPEAIQRYVNELADKRASNTVRRIFSVIRGVLRVAVERRCIAVNPMRCGQAPSQGRRAQRRTEGTDAVPDARRRARAGRRDARA